MHGPRRTGRQRCACGFADALAAVSEGQTTVQTPTVMTSAEPTTCQSLGYEARRDELMEVAKWLLEQGGLDLDASLRLWERGEQLRQKVRGALSWCTPSGRPMWPATRGPKRLGKVMLRRMGGAYAITELGRVLVTGGLAPTW